MGKIWFRLVGIEVWDLGFGAGLEGFWSDWGRLVFVWVVLRFEGAAEGEFNRYIEMGCSYLLGVFTASHWCCLVNLSHVGGCRG